MNIEVFISHHTDSSLHIVEAIVNKMESNGIRCWYAPRDTQGAYASSIVHAINSCKVFLLILNKPASQSVHVLNELDMVTKRLSRNEEVSVIPFHIADDDISDDAQYYLGRLHWIDATKPSMLERIDELVRSLCHVIKKMPAVLQLNNIPASQYSIISKIPQTRAVFEGRDELLRSIRNCFESGERVLFLEGVGGIGKSELAKQYALRYQNKYKNIIFVSFNDDILSLVCDSNKIEVTNVNQLPDEKNEVYFKRKMGVFRSLADKSTLLVVDNFDVDSDPNFTAFIEGSHDILLTTRNAHSSYHSIPVKSIESKDVLFTIFEQNYGAPLLDEDKFYIEKLFILVESHTYAIELLAKQMKTSFYTGEELYHVFQNGYVSSETEEQIVGREGMNTAIGHIRSLFSVSNLSADELHVLQELALTGINGIPAKIFFKWAFSVENGTIKQIVNQLINRSWIRCDRKSTCQQLSLHPLVIEVILSTPSTKSNAENCRNFLEKMADTLYFVWSSPVSENLLYSESVLSIAEYFAPFQFDKNDPALFEIWCVISNYLWQIGKFADAIRYGTMVYHSCETIYGSDSMLTGHAAFVLAGAYFNSRRLKESIRWYRSGLEHMETYTDQDSIDLALSYEKVARTYTWKYDRDFNLANTYFQKALEIRERLIRSYEEGETIPRVVSRYAADAETTREGISTIYLELGRMYQLMDDYETALEYACKCKEHIERYSPNNISNHAYSIFDQGVCNYHLAVKAEQNDEKDCANVLFHRALELFQDSLTTNVKMRGAVAVDTIDNLEWLGDTYAALHQFGEAANCYIAAISMLKKLFGHDYDRIEHIKTKMEKLQ